MHELRNISLKLFEENIFPHIIGDLKILDSIQPQKHVNSCAVPTAMLILSSLDFVGYLIRTEKNINESEKNITKALQYKEYFPKSIYSNDVIKILCRFYRHGMMHGFYPIQISNNIYGIHKSNDDDLFKNILNNSLYIKSLNVNVISNDFKLFIDKLYDEIKTTTENKFLENINKGFKLIDQKELNFSITTCSDTTIPIGIKMKNKF